MKIHKAGILVLREGRMLLCRKKGSEWWILPGGKYEPGETAEECLLREAREELGVTGLAGIEFVGSFEDVAANEPDTVVRIDLYRAELVEEPVASEEIAELWWLGPENGREKLSPSLVRRILPELTRLGIWG